MAEKIRHRPVSMVVEDIKQSGSKTFLILDDNVAGHPEYSKELFEALITPGHQMGRTKFHVLGERQRDAGNYVASLAARPYSLGLNLYRLPA